MGPIVLVMFGLLSSVGMFVPAVAFALVLLQFPLELVLQSAVPVLVNTSWGNQVTNYVIGLVTVIAVSKSLIGVPRPLAGYFSPAWACAVGVFVWGSISVVWSPGVEEATKVVAAGWPNAVVALVIAPLLVSDVAALRKIWACSLFLGLALCVAMLASPDFTMRHGRLGFAFGSASYWSNSLAVGEVGGVTLLLGALASGRYLGRFSLVIRVASILLGGAVAVLSGSRGQTFYAVALAVLMTPMSVQLRDARSFLGTAVVSLLGLGAVAFIIQTSLTSWEMNRFSVDALLYGQSSGGSRLANVVALAQEWAARPYAWVFGLGFYAFHVLPLTSFDIYSHVLFADLIFELGIPGAVMGLTVVVTAARSSARLFTRFREDPTSRTSVAILSAIALYHTLLINKQGFLYSSMWWFMLLVLIARLDRRAALSVEESGGE
jgi:hypothetical protein